MPMSLTKAPGIPTQPAPGTSSATSSSVPDLSARGAKLLAGTVGLRCQNFTYDVESVQRLLNLNDERFGLTEPLYCDGVIGKKTVGAIRAFQKAVVSAADPEGIVRPGDATLLALCSAIPEGISEPLLTLAYLNAAEETLKALSPGIIDCMTRYDINTPLRQAHFLAQIGHESGELRYRQELASGAAYENNRKLGNTQPGDGSRYKGRGLIQLTGRANYTEYTRTGRLDMDVVADPDQVATNEQLCVDVAGWFWDRHGLNAIADRDDLETITRKINGGLNGLDDRRQLLLRAKTLVGV